MNTVIVSKSYETPPLCEKEILRYAGCKEADREILALLKECVNEAADKLTYKVCYREFPVTTAGDICDFGAISFQSKNLAHNLKNCKSVILFAATIGVEIDRLIAKYGHLAPSKALLLQAIGAERIEALCDLFCEDIAQETGLSARPRFSPGYGDLPLSVQKEIFALLDCERRIGLTLNDSLLMSPSKSVTAFLGLSDQKGKPLPNKCSACTMRNCTFRGAL